MWCFVWSQAEVRNAMRMRDVCQIALIVGLAAFVPATAALAQQPQIAPQQAPAASAPAPVGTEPQQTTAAFGDWVLRCIRSVEAQPPRRLCEVSQSLQVQGGQGPIAQVAFGRPERGQPLRLTVLLPNNIALPSTVKLLTEESDTQPLELPWRRCLPGACVADLEIPPAQLNRLRARNEGGRLTFRYAAGRDVPLPISLRGLAPALDALAKEN